MSAGLTREQRTQAIIDCYRGLPGEWDMLKGVLCIQHYDTKDMTDRGFAGLGGVIDTHIDLIMVASRMDEIRQEALKTRYEQSKHYVGALREAGRVAGEEVDS